MTAAFFDVDNTVVKGSSLFLIGRGLIAHGVVSRRDVARYALVQVLFRLRGEHLGHLAGAQDRALALGAGLLVDDVVATGRQVYEERVAGRLWPQTVALALGHLAAGEQVWLVSAAPVELVQIIAGRLGLTGGLGTAAEVRDGRWTGRLASPILHGSAKAVAVRPWPSSAGCRWADATPTATRSTIRTCWPQSAMPTRSTRTAACFGWPATRAGRYTGTGPSLGAPPAPHCSVASASRSGLSAGGRSPLNGCRCGVGHR